MSKCFIDVEAVKTAMDETVQSIESSIKSVEASIKSTEASIRGLQASACKENNYNAAGLAAAHASLNGLQSKLSQLQSQLVRIQETCTKICEAIQNMEEKAASALSKVIIAALAGFKSSGDTTVTSSNEPAQSKWQDTPDLNPIDSTLKVLEYEYTVGGASADSKYLAEGDWKGEGWYDAIAGALPIDKLYRAGIASKFKISDVEAIMEAAKWQKAGFTDVTWETIATKYATKGNNAANKATNALKIGKTAVTKLTTGLSMMAGVLIDDVIDFRNINKEYDGKLASGLLTEGEAIAAAAGEKTGAHVYNTAEAAVATLSAFGITAAGVGGGGALTTLAAFGGGVGGAFLVGAELDAITYIASKNMGGPVYTSFVDLCGDTGLAVASNDDVENMNAVLNVEARCTNVIREQNGMEPLEIQDVETVSFGECVLDTLKGYGSALAKWASKPHIGII